MSTPGFHVEYQANETGRDFVVGDIHGHLDLLNDELASQGFSINSISH